MALSLQIVHTLPGRLRCRIPDMNKPGYEPLLIEAWMERQPRVEEARCNPVARSLVIRYHEGSGASTEIIEHLKRFRWDKISNQPIASTKPAELAPILANGFLLAMLPFLGPKLRLGLTLFNIAPPLAKGADTLIHEGIKVEVLDAMAIGLAASTGKLYTANLTNFFLRLGEFLEQRTQRHSDRLLRKLLQPSPVMAWVERDGEWTHIPDTEIREGEMINIGPGETIAVDGWVIEGTALVNQGVVTGEDVPVRKEPLSRVISGSVLLEGRLRVEAIMVGEQTTTARIARFIQESLSRRSATQRLAERLADKRVYITLATGALVYALTRDVQRLQSVFLVDYSCALKLGPPVAFKSAMHRSAQSGVLIKGGDSIEQLAEVDTFVFDKTGTLTHSELSVTDVVILATEQVYDKRDLLALVASIEEHANHPLAHAIVSAAKAHELEHISHGEVDYMVAHGLSAEVKGERIVVGSRHYLEEHIGVSFAEYSEQIHTLQEAGKNLLFVANTQRPIGLIALRDTLRAEAASVLSDLRAHGIKRLLLITGDQKQKAHALAKTLGFDEVYAEMEPEQKAKVIAQLQQAGHKVAFIGDGINDGPALTTADVGIAMPKGADIARASADVVLLDDRLSALVDARCISTHTMQLIKRNFNLAIGVNTALFFAAMSGRLSPVASAILHNGTTIAILLSALKGPSNTQTDKSLSK